MTPLCRYMNSRVKKCGKRFECLVTAGKEKDVVCAECGSADVQKMISCFGIGGGSQPHQGLLLGLPQLLEQILQHLPLRTDPVREDRSKGPWRMDERKKGRFIAALYAVVFGGFTSYVIWNEWANRHFAKALDFLCTRSASSTVFSSAAMMPISVCTSSPARSIWPASATRWAIFFIRASARRGEGVSRP